MVIKVKCLKHVVVVLTNILFLFQVNAQGITVSSGSLILDGSIYLVITDGGFTNNGNFVADKSNIIFTGTAIISNSFIGGSNPFVFNNITINKSAFGVKLNRDITFNGNLYMQSDSLYLNGNTLNMGSGAAIVGESVSSPITGLDGGKISLSLNLNSPNALNPGNIGLEITSQANLGMVNIKRGYLQQTIASDRKSILRYYDINAANNSALNATVKFYYIDAEIAGNNKTALTMYSSEDNGSSWTLLGKDESDLTNDWVLKNGINQFNRLTLANSTNSALPVKLISFSGKYINNSSLLIWQTASEQNSSYFNILSSLDGNIFNSIGKVAAAGTINQIQNYSFIDANGYNANKLYYRLEMVDKDDKKEYSKIISMNILQTKDIITISPNPVREKVQVLFNGIQISNNAYLVLRDVYGKKIMTKQINPNTISVEIPVINFSRGIYWLNLYTGQKIFSGKILKQ